MHNDNQPDPVNKALRDKIYAVRNEQAHLLAEIAKLKVELKYRPTYLTMGSYIVAGFAVTVLVKALV